MISYSTLIKITLLCWLGLAIGAIILFFNSHGIKILIVSEIIFGICSIALLYVNSTIWKNKKYRLLLLSFILLAILGFLFKIMHWPAANILIISALSALLIIYGVRFFRKKYKKLLDYAKVIWFTAAISMIILRVSPLTLKYNEYWEWIPHILFYLMIIIIVINYYKDAESSST